jgi:hypothetical protein
MVSQAVERTLELSVDPPSPAQLDPGTLIRVSARPVPWASMLWVSGTVQIFGAPVGAFRRAADGSWKFRTMVPPMATVPPGSYRIKAWGRTRDGAEIRGELTYKVE